jgi:hypothetical protein
MNKRIANTPDDLSHSAIRLLAEGDIDFDATGSAVYRGSSQHLLDNSLIEQELRLDAGQPSMTLPTSGQYSDVTTLNPGFDPYSHQAPTRTIRAKKPNLRELSKWIELKKRLEAKE